MLEYLLAQGVTAWDLLILAGLFIVWPISQSISMWLNPPDSLDTSETSKLLNYNFTMLVLWCMAFLVVGAWLLQGRPLAMIGFRFDATAPTLVVCGLVALISAFFLFDLVRTAFSKKARTKAYESLTKAKYTEHVVPASGREWRRAMALSVTAGITEEIIFRGYTIWALALVMPLWVAGCVAALLFTLLHRYHGLTGMLQVAALAGVFSALYIIGQSLWPVIILHIAIDVLVLSRLRIALRAGRDRLSAAPA